MSSSGSSNFKPAGESPTPSGAVDFGSTSAPTGWPSSSMVLPGGGFMTPEMMSSRWAAAPPPELTRPTVTNAPNPQIAIDSMRAEIAKMIADSQAKQQVAAQKEAATQQMYARAGGGGYAGFGGGRSSSNGYGGSARGGPGGFGGSSARGGRAY